MLLRLLLGNSANGPLGHLQTQGYPCCHGVSYYLGTRGGAESCRTGLSSERIIE